MIISYNIYYEEEEDFVFQNSFGMIIRKIPTMIIAKIDPPRTLLYPFIFNVVH